jgi:hypothetical protein
VVRDGHASHPTADTYVLRSSREGHLPECSRCVGLCRPALDLAGHPTWPPPLPKLRGRRPLFAGLRPQPRQGRQSPLERLRRHAGWGEGTRKHPRPLQRLRRVRTGHVWGPLHGLPDAPPVAAESPPIPGFRGHPGAIAGPCRHVSRATHRSALQAAYGAPGTRVTRRLCRDLQRSPESRTGVCEGGRWGGGREGSVASSAARPGPFRARSTAPPASWASPVNSGVIPE